MSTKAAALTAANLPESAIRDADSIEEVVQIIGKVCPWMKEATVDELMRYHRGECDELIDEVRAYEEKSPESDDANKVEDEFGDLIFGVLMLGEKLGEKIPSFSMDRAREKACMKIKGRVGYIWGEDRWPQSVAEATVCFKRNKERMKEDASAK